MNKSKLYILGIIVLIIFSVTTTIYKIKKTPNKENTTAIETTAEITTEVTETPTLIDTTLDEVGKEYEILVTEFKQAYIEGYNSNDVKKINPFSIPDTSFYNTTKENFAKNNKKTNLKLKDLSVTEYKIEGGNVKVHTTENIGYKNKKEKDYTYKTSNYIYKIQLEVAIIFSNMEEV